MSAKVKLNKSYRESSIECMLELHWLKVEYRILYRYKNLNTVTIAYLERHWTT